MKIIPYKLISFSEAAMKKNDRRLQTEVTVAHGTATPNGG